MDCSLREAPRLTQWMWRLLLRSCNLKGYSLISYSQTESRLSSNPLDPKTLVDILFEAYSPAAFPRTIEQVRADNAAWMLMFDARHGANGFFLTPSDNAEEKNRIWANPEQAFQALGMNEPLFTAFAKACALLPSTAIAPASKSLPDRNDLIDVLSTELGTVSLEALANDFQLTVSYRNKDQTGHVERSRSVVRAPILRSDLAKGVALGLSPLRAACEHAPQNIQLLFPQDRMLDAKAIRVLLKRDIDKAKPITTSAPNKPTGL